MPNRTEHKWLEQTAWIESNSCTFGLFFPFVYINRVASSLVELKNYAIDSFFSDVSV